MLSNYSVRRAERADIDTIVDFTRREAREAEGVTLDPEAVMRGVAMPFDDVSLATYWIAETARGEIVASTSIVKEWSNFRGGHYWWLQSLFVVPEHRGGGLADLLINHVAREATAAGALDLRLYAHHSNHRAHRVYRRCGFVEAPYIIMTRR